MLQSSRAVFFLLLSSALALSGCNKDPVPAGPGPGGNATNAGPAAVNRWPDRSAMLAAAPPEKLTTKEVQVGEETYLLDVPAGAKITTPDTDTIINVEIAPEKQYSIRWAPEDIVFFKKIEAQNGHDKFLYLDNDTLVALKRDGKINASMNLHDEYRDLGVRIGWAWNGKDWTEKDFMLAFKSAATLRVKTPYEKDPLAVAKRLKVNVSNGTPEEVKEVSFPIHATTSTLKMLQFFPNIEELVFRLTAGFDERPALPELAKLEKLRVLKFDGGSVLDLNISQQWLRDIAQCANLEELQLDWDLTTSGELESLGKLTNLKALKIRANQEALGGSEALSALQKLKKLSVWLDADEVPTILGDFLASLGKLPELEELIVEGGIKGVVDADLAKLAAFPKLRVLEWKSSALSSAGSPNLQKSSLKELKLDSNYGDQITLSKEFIAGLPTALTTLELSKLGLDEGAVAAVASLPNLEKLIVYKCPIKRQALLKLADSKSLKTITRAYGDEPPLKKDFEALKKARPELDISHLK